VLTAERIEAPAEDRWTPAPAGGWPGPSKRPGPAIAEFGEAHADLTEADHRELSAAAAAGRIQARSDI
jgi:hypothetical protein